MRVGVLGAGGRMGATVCAAVAAASDLDLVAAVDPVHADETAPGGGRIRATIDALNDGDAEVAVDFTRADVARANVDWCADNGVHAVVGTTGFGDDDLARFETRFAAEDAPNCVIAPNFAIGAVLMMRFAEQAARWFDTAEIVELHHDAKTDAPSGTALLTAARLDAASDQWAPDPTRDEVLAGARGGVAAGGIHVHSVRLRGLVAHQEVLMGATGQTLTIRHDSYDRVSFMPGVLLAVREVARRPGLTIGLDPLLGD